jgi:hypothetical protein
MQFYDGSEKSSFSLSPQSSSSNELESQSDIEVAPMAGGGVGGVGRVGTGAGGGAAEEKEESAALSLSRNDGNTAKKTSLGIPMHPVPDIEIAELTKIIENAHRYLQIAFAEDLYLYCQANNINFAELRDSLNTKWNVNVLEPREGIGGHCLPKDTKMFLNSSKSIKSKILEAAIEVDNEYRRRRGISIESSQIGVDSTIRTQARQQTS